MHGQRKRILFRLCHFYSGVFPTITSNRIGDDFSFDEKMAEYGCTVSAFDPSMGKEDHNHSAGVMFYSLGLSDVNQEGAKNRLSADQQNKRMWKTRTLAAIIQELEHTQVINKWTENQSDSQLVSQ